MFTARQIKEKLETKPFKPFGLLMSNGKAYYIPNHDAAWVAAGSVVIGRHLNQEGFAETYVACAILYITSIEDLQAA
jgi:hypothetical protein